MSRWQTSSRRARVFQWLAGVLSVRTRRAVSGLGADYVGNGVTQILSFVFTPTIVALLSPQMYGFWVVASQVLFWLNLLDGGTGLYLIKSIANRGDATEADGLNEAVATVFWIYVLLGIVMAGCGFALAPRLPIWAHIDPTEAAVASRAFRIAVVTSTISLVAMPTFYAILQGYQRIALANGIIYGTSALNLIIAVSLLYRGGTVTSMAVAQLISMSLGALIAYGAARRVCRFSVAPRWFRQEQVRKIVRFTVYFQMNKLAFLASTFSDSFLLAGSMGAASVTTYTLTQKLPQTASFFVTKIGGVLLPGLAELFGQQDTSALQRVVLRLLRLLTRAGLFAAILLFSVNGRFMSLWVGDRLYGGLALTVLFAYLVFYNALVGNLSTLFFASGELKGWGWVSIVSAVTKIALTIIWLPRLGLLAPVAATVASGLIPGVYATIKAARLLDLPIARLWREGVAPSLPRSIPTCVVVGVLGAGLPTEYHWFGMIGIVGAATFANLLSFDLGVFQQVRLAWAPRS